MRCIVTAGPTYEPLDQVRRLTNFSTGRLGTELARHLADVGHEVMLLRGALATFHESPAGVEVRTFGTTAELGAQLTSLATSERAAVLHVAAVSDFGFGSVFVREPAGGLSPVGEGKISTDRRDLLVELKPTPKLIRVLRDQFPKSVLVGWKYEVDGSREDSVDQGRRQIREAATDACVVNGPAYGPGFGIVTPRSDANHLDGRRELFEALTRLLAAD